MDNSVKEKFNNAFKLHSSGKTEDAEKLYLEILRNNPENYEVLNLLGILYLAQNKLDLAEKHILKAISIKKMHIFMKTWQEFTKRKKNSLL